MNACLAKIKDLELAVQELNDETSDLHLRLWKTMRDLVASNRRKKEDIRRAHGFRDMNRRYLHFQKAVDQLLTKHKSGSNDDLVESLRQIVRKHFKNKLNAVI